MGESVNSVHQVEKLDAWIKACKKLENYKQSFDAEVLEADEEQAMGVYNTRYKPIESLILQLKELVREEPRKEPHEEPRQVSPQDQYLLLQKVQRLLVEGSRAMEFMTTELDALKKIVQHEEECRRAEILTKNLTVELDPEVSMQEVVIQALIASAAAYQDKPAEFLTHVQKKGATDYYGLHNLNHAIVSVNAQNDVGSQHKFVIAETDQDESIHRKLCIIAYRGSYEFVDHYTNIQIAAAESEIGFIHQGFFNRASEFPLSFIFDQLEKGYTVILTGHSLGGAVATIVTLLFLEKYGADLANYPNMLQKLICITFGAPPVGDALTASRADFKKFKNSIYKDSKGNEFSRTVSSFFHHIIAKDDIIPGVTLALEKLTFEQNKAQQNRSSFWHAVGYFMSPQLQQETWVRIKKYLKESAIQFEYFGQYYHLDETGCWVSGGESISHLLEAGSNWDFGKLWEKHKLERYLGSLRAVGYHDTTQYAIHPVTSQPELFIPKLDLITITSTSPDFNLNINIVGENTWFVRSIIISSTADPTAFVIPLDIRKEANGQNVTKLVPTNENIRRMFSGVRGDVKLKVRLGTHLFNNSIEVEAEKCKFTPFSPRLVLFESMPPENLATYAFMLKVLTRAPSQVSVLNTSHGQVTSFFRAFTDVEQEQAQGTKVHEQGSKAHELVDSHIQTVIAHNFNQASVFEQLKNSQAIIAARFETSSKILDDSVTLYWSLSSPRVRNAAVMSIGTVAIGVAIFALFAPAATTAAVAGMVFEVVSGTTAAAMAGGAAAVGAVLFASLGKTEAEKLQTILNLMGVAKSTNASNYHLEQTLFQQLARYAQIVHISIDAKTTVSQFVRILEHVPIFKDLTTQSMFTLARIIRAALALYFMRTYLTELKVVGVVGPKNCGKSTIIKGVFDIDVPRGTDVSTVVPFFYRAKFTGDSEVYVIDFPGFNENNSDLRVFTKQLAPLIAVPILVVQMSQVNADIWNGDSGCFGWLREINQQQPRPPILICLTQSDLYIAQSSIFRKYDCRSLSDIAARINSSGFSTMSSSIGKDLIEKTNQARMAIFNSFQAQNLPISNDQLIQIRPTSTTFEGTIFSTGQNDPPNIQQAPDTFFERLNNAMKEGNNNSADQIIFFRSKDIVDWLYTQLDKMHLIKSGETLIAQTTK